MRYWIVPVFFALILVSLPADAAVEFCNRLSVPLEVSFAYPKNTGTWASKGWYVIPGGECQIVHAQDDLGEGGGKATYYYYAVAFMGEDQLTWAGDENSAASRNFCFVNDVYDIDRTDESCESRGYKEKSFLAMEVSVAPGKKHVIKFNPPPGMIGSSTAPASSTATAAPKLATPAQSGTQAAP